MYSEYVYFIKAGLYCKIGHSCDPESRVTDLATGCPYVVQLMLKIPHKTRKAALEAERHYQKEFTRYHHRREWFTLCQEIRDFIKNYKRASKEEDVGTLWMEQDPRDDSPEIPTAIYLTEKQVAKLLQVSPSFLQKDRGLYEDTRIPYYKIGTSVRYRYDEVIRHVDNTRMYFKY